MGSRKRKKKETGRGWGSGRGDSDVRGTGIKNEKDSGQELQGALEDQCGQEVFFSISLCKFFFFQCHHRPSTSSHLSPLPPLTSPLLSFHLWHLAVLLHSGCHRWSAASSHCHVTKKATNCCHLIRLGWVARRGRAAASIRPDGNSLACTHADTFYSTAMSNYTPARVPKPTLHTHTDGQTANMC